MDFLFMFTLCRGILDRTHADGSSAPILKCGGSLEKEVAVAPSNLVSVLAQLDETMLALT
jgi:hypothetical protein